ncbi:hypothetical protein [Alkalimarinus alittae]|uniref:Uncharacterized protein n=1 Tax=Alkalimarinus alittae TaxID=2961619 RepID=A0ABY6N6R2_9ALTE|nr:hypothetical protein [Alkalimarinus alittae]UZE97797.1 hypothetical protein NKI27_08710 [Alkalimarinus alittae]
MIVSQSYLIAWGIYLLSALGLIIVFWRMTRSIPFKDVKKVLRLVGVVLLLTPVDLGLEATWFAPAYLVGGYEWIIGNSHLAIKAGIHLLGALTLLTALLTLEYIVRKLLHLQQA